MGDDARPAKARKVEQNHSISITSIQVSTMDHYCTVTICPDHLNPDGLVKRGIRINCNEFSKGIKVLSERCGYRLLSPLTSFAYSGYLNKATEDFLKNGSGGGPSKPVVQVYNQSPFRWKSRFFVAKSTSAGQAVYELFAKEGQGFAKEVSRNDLPFQLNWCGPNIKDMKVDDYECLRALVMMVKTLEELQPKIPGLGVCSLVEFGRLLCYNLLVDGKGSESLEDSEDDSDTDDTSQESEARGYKQLLLVLQSTQVETGKSLLADICSRIFHGKQVGLNSTITFNCAKTLLGRGEPVLIDDFNNDEIGCTLISRASKAIWGKSIINIKNESVTPSSNILLCTNEEIKHLKVEGRNKDEIYQKMSVIDLGEVPMGSDGNKVEKIKEVFELTKVIRNCLPSFFGVILQCCGQYITPDQFQEFKDITSHERMANILKNANNFQQKLISFCESVDIEKPVCLQNQLDTSCLTNKSELVLKSKNPEQIINLLMENSEAIVITEHDQKKGALFSTESLTKYPWLKGSLSWVKAGDKVYKKVRTRQLSANGEQKIAFFLNFEFLRTSSVDKIKDYVKTCEKENPRVTIANSFIFECKRYEEVKKERFDMGEKYIMDQVNNGQPREVGELSKVKCDHCGFVSRSKRGLTQHMKRKHK